MLYIDPNVKVLATNEEMMGRKYKLKVSINNRVHILKFEASNFEIFAELIAEELGAQAGIDMAHYEVCEYKGRIGLITPSFLNVEGDELIISSRSLSEASQKICEENNLKMSLKDNTVENIIRAASIFDERINSKELSRELVKRWIFYGMIMESDKNNTNISFIKNRNMPLRISPDYDNSTMARMNEKVTDFIEAMKFGSDIYSITDNVKTALRMNSKSGDEFLPDYRIFVEKHGLEFKDIMDSFRNISVDAAIEAVEEMNDIQIPWEISFWLSKSIESRKEEMIKIFDEKVKKEEKTKVLK